jgi:multicomponent K+:H+ antiporter subunit D
MSADMMSANMAFSPHLVVAPLLIPLVAGSAILLIDEKRREWKAGLGLVALLAQLVVSVVLLRHADADLPLVYRLGDWPAPFAITLVLDRLSALMVTLTATLGLAAYVYALAGWSRVGAYFHTLFQFLLAGLSGAFLTGDLFNLFVFFELLLAASYGLALHGSGGARVAASLHYVAVNLFASLAILVGVALIYAVTGSLNMAEVATHVSALTDAERTLFEAGAGVLALAFLVKAGMWPLCFWLAPTYGAAVAPAAAMFAIMTKVGAYALLRLSPLLFGVEAGASQGYGAQALIAGGLATLLFGALSALGARTATRLGAACVLTSAGTLIACVGFARVGVTAGALFYLVGSSLAGAAFFLLAELVERWRGVDSGAALARAEADAEMDEEFREDEEVGRVFSANKSLLGLAFLGCAAMFAGAPPLSTFFGKVAMLEGALGGGAAHADSVAPSAWVFFGVTLASGLMTLIGATRLGMALFWSDEPTSAGPKARALELAPMFALILLALAQAVFAGPAMRYMQSTALSLHAPRDYLAQSLHPAEGGGGRGAAPGGAAAGKAGGAQ